ncbi:MAG: hypothetical protein HS116_18380 [Planctomycetes bacterium]|nr:hypothetical protein [Planctomycetota bacterium]
MRERFQSVPAPTKPIYSIWLTLAVAVIASGATAAYFLSRPGVAETPTQKTTTTHEAATLQAPQNAKPSPRERVDYCVEILQSGITTDEFNRTKSPQGSVIPTLSKFVQPKVEENFYYRARASWKGLDDLLAELLKVDPDKTAYAMEAATLSVLYNWPLSGNFKGTRVDQSNLDQWRKTLSERSGIKLNELGCPILE